MGRNEKTTCSHCQYDGEMQRWWVMMMNWLHILWFQPKIYICVSTAFQMHIHSLCTSWSSLDNLFGGGSKERTESIRRHFGTSGQKMQRASFLMQNHVWEINYFELNALLLHMKNLFHSCWALGLTEISHFSVLEIQLFHITKQLVELLTE